MKLEPLYRVEFEYPEGWFVDLPGGWGQLFAIAEGRAAGRISGRFRGANHPRLRTDGTFMPDFQGVIETDDGATIFFDYRGYGRAYPQGRRQIVSTALHVSGDDGYAWLNDVVCVGAGEVRSNGDDTTLVLDVAELVWEPPGYDFGG